jgi:hypothetical protein
LILVATCATIQPAPTSTPLPLIEPPSPIDTPIPPTETSIDILEAATIGKPINSNGVVFTVMEVNDFDQIFNWTEDNQVERPVNIQVRIKNIEHSLLTISPEVFSLVDTDGKHNLSIGLIFGDEHPPDKRELAQGQQIHALIQNYSDKNIEDLTLWYTPIQDNEPLRVQLIKQKEASRLNFTSQDLIPLLIQEGDFPDLYEGYVIITDFSGANFPVEWDEPTEYARQGIMYENEMPGSVAVLAYESLDTVDGVFSNYENQGLASVYEVGERALYQEISSPNTEMFSKIQYLYFVRCHTFVIIILLPSETHVQIPFDELKSYAQKLDNRLVPIVCE